MDVKIKRHTFFKHYKKLASAHPTLTPKNKPPGNFDTPHFAHRDNPVRAHFLRTQTNSRSIKVLRLLYAFLAFPWLHLTNWDSFSL